jgi:hypothetical protein
MRQSISGVGKYTFLTMTGALKSAKQHFHASTDGGGGSFHEFFLLSNVGSTVVESNYVVLAEMEEWKEWGSGDFSFGVLHRARKSDLVSV